MTMDLAAYPYSFIKKFDAYIFHSEGPKGNITKAVVFQKVETGHFNLAFGDWVALSGYIDDEVRSDNKDTEKILITIARVVLDFFRKNPEATVFVAGNTPARTRLYQMYLRKHLREIMTFVEVSG